MLVQNAGQTAEADQFLRSASGISWGRCKYAGISALSSVITVLQRAISLGVEGANGTLNSSDRAGTRHRGSGDSITMLNLANLYYQGDCVFAGTATQTAPYVLDFQQPFARNLRWQLQCEPRHCRQPPQRAKQFARF